ncbi:MAG: lysozyme inhibitor LprI family protein [Clostridium perfringens]|nr:lysozyme inhibitor LprI family protein [Clostridium perfringens]
MEKEKISFNLICFFRNRILVVIMGLLIVNTGYLLCRNNLFNNTINLKSNKILLTQFVSIEEVSKKDNYLREFEELNEEVNELISGNIDETQSHMSKLAYKAYVLWDNELNKIYSDLKENLTEKEFTKLQSEEISWISYKEEIAKDNAKKYRGGSAYNFVLNVSLAQLTKERCYYLVSVYM